MFKMKSDYYLTKENMLLGLVQGKAVDIDDSGAATTIYDWGTEFGQSQLARSRLRSFRRLASIGRGAQEMRRAAPHDDAEFEGAWRR